MKKLQTPGSFARCMKQKAIFSGDEVPENPSGELAFYEDEDWIIDEDARNFYLRSPIYYRLFLMSDLKSLIKNRR